MKYLLGCPLDKLLPDEPPLRKQLLKKTLVINLEDTLYSKNFEMGEGMQIQLRPGFYSFLKRVLKYYDLVVYSNEDTAHMQEVIMLIDPYQQFFP